MDDLDRRILEAAQREFPLEADPYARLAEVVGSDAETVFRRAAALGRRGAIRRLAALFDSRRLGRVTTLVALRLPARRVARVARLVNRYPEVTHNYQRRHEWNLWFTLIARSRARIRQILAALRRDAGLAQEDMMELPAGRVVKIDVRFPARQKLRRRPARCGNKAARRRAMRES